ncbi:PIR protein [Plasmodium ovale]|uniref:PIR protein n=2 Tax=Plasmodium ovale TaxID=36330 RepID=A0A1D3JDU4_PLAOA|nr:PIR protein [Plasmodium ovale]
MEGHERSSCEYKISENLAHSNYIRQVCKNIETHLSQLKNLISTIHLADVAKGCEYLGYWIYDKIKHINSSRDDIQNLYRAINYLNLLNGLNGKCSNIRDFNISEDKFNKKKELFFHTENLFWIEKKYSTIISSDPSLYGKYLDECAKYYRKFMLDYYCKNREDYKSELVDFSTNFNRTKNFLKEQKIQIVLEDLKSPETFDCTLESKIPEEEGPVASHPHDPQNHRGGEQDALIDDVDSAGTNPGTIAGTGLGISFVMLLSYFFLYKFKGYQHFIRPLIQKEKKLLSNLEDEDNEIIQISDPNQMNLDNTSYHVNYSAHDY